jgi:hypothetical protein
VEVLREAGFTPSEVEAGFTPSEVEAMLASGATAQAP